MIEKPTEPLSLTLCLVCALNCEAKALIDRYRLKKVGDKPFANYAGKGELNGHAFTIKLIISGIGALNMATAIGWLGAGVDSKKAAWLNVGIAGHGSLAVGEAFVVSSAQDLLNPKTYYPPQVARRPVATSPCMSVNAPSTDYPEEGGIDMEVSAFYQAAIKFSEAECVQAFKVVSDNPDHSPESLNAQRIHQFVQPHTDQIIAFAQSLLVLAGLIPSAESKLVLPADLKATHSLRQQFEDLSRRLGFLYSLKEIEALQAELNACADSKSVITRMSTIVAEFEPNAGSNTA